MDCKVYRLVVIFLPNLEIFSEVFIFPRFIDFWLQLVMRRLGGGGAWTITGRVVWVILNMLLCSDPLILHLKTYFTDLINQVLAHLPLVHPVPLLHILIVSHHLVVTTLVNGAGSNTYLQVVIFCDCSWNRKTPIVTCLSDSFLLLRYFRMSSLSSRTFFTSWIGLY